MKKKYNIPISQFIYIFQSSNEGEENKIRIKVVEGPQLEACEIATDKVVKQIVKRLNKWNETKNDNIWLPEVVAENFEVSPWFDEKIAQMTNKGE